MISCFRMQYGILNELLGFILYINIQNCCKFYDFFSLMFVHFLNNN